MDKLWQEVNYCMENRKNDDGNLQLKLAIGTLTSKKWFNVKYNGNRKIGRWIDHHEQGSQYECYFFHCFCSFQGLVT